MKIEFKYRNKLWNVTKEPHCFSLNKLGEGEEWKNVGYYSCPNEMFKKLVKEHLITETTQKEIAKTIKDTCNELETVFKEALKSHRGA